MPLVRFPVRNEYGLGQPELYKEANKEDPKAVLDGVAVAGLVGILRQLGDLAEFAAEVFHGLQEQVMATASRSHKLMVRVQCIEGALPPLEKAVLAQTSHIHFAYTAGSEWHPCIPNERNHFIYNDLPRFIMDSYEECHNPPRLHLLDKFDAGSPGSCLKRYSDPTFFKRVSGSPIEATSEKIQRDKKARKSKKKRSSQRNGEISRVASMSNHSHSGRMHLTSLTVNGRTSSQTASTVDMTLKCDLGDHSSSFDSRTGSGYIEGVFSLGSSLQTAEQGAKESSSRLMQDIDILDSAYSEEPTQMVDNNFPHSSPEKTVPNSSCVTWDEKAEIVEPQIQQCDRSEASEVLSAKFDIDTPDRGTAKLRNVDQMDILFDREAPEVLSANFDVDTPDRGTAIPRNVDQMDILLAENDTPKSISSEKQLDEIESETDNYMDALNTIESESENDLDCQTKWEVEQYSPSVNNGRIEDGIEEPTAHSSDQCPSYIESHTISSISSSNRMLSGLPDPVPSESIVHARTPQISGKSSDLDHSPGADMFATFSVLDGSKVEPVIRDSRKVEPVISDPSSSGSRISDLHDQSGIRAISSFCESQQSHAEFSNDQSGISIVSSVCESQLSRAEFSKDESGVGVLSSVCESQQCHAEFSKDESGVRVVSSACESQQSHAEFSKDESDVRVVSSACQSQQSHAEFSNDQSGARVISGVHESQQSHAEFSRNQSCIRIMSSFCEPQQSHAEFSSVQSVKFWTNGGLLGLEPSKPSDFAMSNSAGRDDVARSKFSHPNIAVKGDGQNEKLDTLIENPEGSEKVSSSSIDKADADSKLEKSIGYHNSKRFNHGEGGGLNVTAVAARGTELPPDVKATSSETNQENDGNSSLVFELGHRLLVNGFRRKLSLVHDDKSEPVNSLETGAFDRQHGHHHDACQRMEKTTFMERFGHGAPLGSLTSSPPLEHMKISFKPADGFETSKLGLKFPDGSQCAESIRDMFPSFQLVPEPAISSHEYCSDSDDDTFYRSSPYMSDDCRSHHSESNSEQWESSPEGSNHHELYDALGQMSSMGSVSSSLQVEEAAKHGMHANYGLKNMHTENGAEPCSSCLDLPSFDAMNSVLQGETKTDSEPKNLSKLLHSIEHTPLPPPLPPVEWRVSKPHSDVAEEKQYAESDSPRQALQQKCLESSMSQHPEPAPADQQLTVKDAFVFGRESKQEDQQNLNWKKEVNQKANGNWMDEKEDFLHQIRTKSFSLRPTVAARPTFSTCPAANNKVTAILEKANAIRQAVASDDGDDDDTWSDA